MVKQGYKQTEIGLIPEDWTVDTIDSVTLSVATGGNYKNSIQRSPYPLIKMGNLSRGHINLNKIEYVIDSVPSEKDRLSYGDVLFNTRNTPELVGKVAVWKNELPIAYFNSNLLRFNFNCEKSNPFFMNLIFNTKQVIAEFKNISKGTTSVAAIYPQDMLKVKIKIPPIQEQNRIAEALSDVDSMISSLEKLIAKKKAVKQGAMQELLTGKKRLPGFAGDIEHKPLSSLCAVFADGDWIESKDQSNDGIRLIQTGNIGSGKYLDKSDKQRFISEDTFNRLKCLEIFENDVLVSRLPDPAGRACILPNSSKRRITAVDCTIIRFINYNPILFVAYSQTKEYQDKVDMAMAGSTRQRISRKELGDILIPVFPSKEEQNAIASILSDMNNEIEALEQKLTKTRQIKQGMMQQLLTGKIRLV